LRHGFTRVYEGCQRTETATSVGEWF
jgi:hypothetical protein